MAGDEASSCQLCTDVVHNRAVKVEFIFQRQKEANVRSKNTPEQNSTVD